MSVAARRRVTAGIGCLAGVALGKLMDWVFAGSIGAPYTVHNRRGVVSIVDGSVYIWLTCILLGCAAGVFAASKIRD